MGWQVGLANAHHWWGWCIYFYVRTFLQLHSLSFKANKITIYFELPTMTSGSSVMTPYWQVGSRSQFWRGYTRLTTPWVMRVFPLCPSTLWTLNHSGCFLSCLSSFKNALFISQEYIYLSLSTLLIWLIWLQIANAVNVLSTLPYDVPSVYPFPTLRVASSTDLEDCSTRNYTVITFLFAPITIAVNHVPFLTALILTFAHLLRNLFS